MTSPGSSPRPGDGPAEPAPEPVGSFRVVPFRPERNATLDTLRWGRKGHHVPMLVEVDVTDARAALRDLRERTGTAPGLTAWLRDLVFWRPLLRSPARIKATMGTVVVTSAGMAAPGVLARGIPVALHPLAIAVDGVARRSTPEGPREVLALTVVFDHAVTDGGPVGRFVHRLHQLLTGADGLTPDD